MVLKTLNQRRQDRCLSFSIRCTKHSLNSRLFPKNHNKYHDIRSPDMFVVNNANNNFYRDSAVPYCQQLLNTHMRDMQRGKAGEGEK